MGYIGLDELSNEMIEYLNTLGLTEEQVQGLISAGLVSTNTRVDELQTSLTNAWSTINEINTRELSGQQYKLTTDDGTCKNIPGNDCNNLIHTGYYMGFNLTNAPNNDTSSWFMVHVIRHNDMWTYQMATDFAYSQKMYVRYQCDGNWLPWRLL